MDAASEIEMTSWFTVRELDTQTWAIDDHGNNVLYLLTGSERALLIDTGWGLGDLPTLVTSFTSFPLIVVNTHGHPDHVGGDGQFSQVHITVADRYLAIGFLSPDERKWAVENKTLPQPFPSGFDFDRWLNATATFVSIAGGDIIELGERRLGEPDLLRALRESVPPATVDRNTAAFEKGKKHVRSHFLRSHRCFASAPTI